MAEWIQEELEQNHDTEATDIKRMINFCQLYPSNQISQSTSSDAEYLLESPTFQKDRGGIRSSEFQNRYNYVIKIVYTMMRLDVPFYRVSGHSTVFCTMYQLDQNISDYKREIVAEHIKVLREQARHAEEDDYTQYCQYNKMYLHALKIAERIRHLIRKALESGVLNKTDNLLTLLIPYFRKKEQYIEEYEI